MIRIYFDGSYRQKKLLNAWWGFVVFDDQGLSYFTGGRERVSGAAAGPIAAELKALLHAMEWAESQIPRQEAVEFIGDALHIIQFMRGEIAKAKKMRKMLGWMLDDMTVKAKLYPGWSFSWVPRQQNSLADGLAEVGSAYTTPAIARMLLSNCRHPKNLAGTTAEG